jgi:Ca-activated chloride channel family protein
MAKPLDLYYSEVATRLATLGILTVLLLASAPAVAQPTAVPAAQPQAIFRAGVEVVTISASVRTSGGKVVKDLQRADFEVLDSGQPVTIRDFHAGESAISLAILLDISGSMAVGGNMDRARQAVGMVTMSLRDGEDEATLFTFDSSLRQVFDYTSDLATVHRLNLTGKPWGSTSLYDAIGDSARSVAKRSNRHRALLVITDGVDTNSRLTAAQVSGIASSIDVPVYLLVVVNPADHPGGEFEALPPPDKATQQASLVDLARWTGGDTMFASVPSHTSVAVQGLMAELRHQYLITFEPGERPGWHPLEVRTRKKSLVVHARGGYMAAPRTGS